jgi:hypothetical protein
MDSAPLFEGTTKYCPPDPNYFKNFGRRRMMSKRSLRFGKDYALSQDSQLGLPSDQTSPPTIYDTFPDPFQQGSPLPQPYGPRDNLRMMSLWNYGRKLRKLRRKNKHYKRLRSRNGFGLIYNGQEYVDNILAPAKGYIYSYLPIDPNNVYNVPMQYSNNTQNTPIFTTTPTMRFGQMLNTNGMYGVNNVAYQTPIPMLHAGGTTLNYANNQLYSPIGVVGGPTNSTGQFASAGTFSEPVMNVVNDNITPNSYLNTKPINVTATDANSTMLKDGMTTSSSFGKRKRSFGNMIYQPDMITGGGGNEPVYQKSPMYMDTKATPTGNYANYGKKPKLVMKNEEEKKEEKKGKKTEKKEEKTLTTKFNNYVITLKGNNKVTVRKN